MDYFGKFLVTTSLILLIMVNIGEGGSLGINFGRQATQKLLPSMVVDMCLANGISKVKLFSVNEGVMKAFMGTNIELILAIPNIEMKEISSDEEKVRVWMNKYITKYLKDKVNNEDNIEKLNIRYLCVGVEPFAKIVEDKSQSFNDIISRVGQTLKIIDKIRDGDNYLKKLKLGVPVATNVLEPVLIPSEGDFHKDYKTQILDILPILSKMDAPFMINIYPYYSITMDNRLPLEFGLFDNKSNYTINDGGRIYTNLFDLKYDTLVWALRKNGYGHLKIMVSQVGWPTDGGLGANVENAKRFYDGLLKKVASNQGTPLLPKADLDVYLYVLSDENQRRITRGDFERHYGIFEADGRPKFNIDFTLQGRDIKPESAQGVLYLPERWCILKDEYYGKLKKEFLNTTLTDTCNQGDCTAIADGGSCSSLNMHDKLSYAFNNFFQMSNQELAGGDAACDFNGMGNITHVKPKFEGCEFPVQILSTLFVNGLSNTEMIATLGADTDFAGEMHRLSYLLILILPLLWIVERWM